MLPARTPLRGGARLAERAVRGRGEERDLEALVSGLHNLIEQMKIWDDPEEIVEFLYKFTRRIRNVQKELRRALQDFDHEEFRRSASDWRSAGVP
jgi:predicted secreted Zn-dependent protease